MEARISGNVAFGTLCSHKAEEPRLLPDFIDSSVSTQGSPRLIGSAAVHFRWETVLPQARGVAISRRLMGRELSLVG